MRTFYIEYTVNKKAYADIITIHTSTAAVKTIIEKFPRRKVTIKSIQILKFEGLRQ